MTRWYNKKNWVAQSLKKANKKREKKLTKKLLEVERMLDFGPNAGRAKDGRV